MPLTLPKGNTDPFPSVSCKFSKSSLVSAGNSLFSVMFMVLHALGYGYRLSIYETPKERI